MSDLDNCISSCPIPIQQYPHVLLAHGGGGKLMHQLIEKMFIATYGNPTLTVQHDTATLTINEQRLAFTNDSYVVQPLFFPGGDIGTLAIDGTVNDLAMAGARPLYLSASFILEEGLAMETLWKVVQSMQTAAQAANVAIVIGDTKVVERGKGDGLFINTAGIGAIEHTQSIAPQSVQPSDAILLNGDIGRHGIAIMAVREGLEFESNIESDCAPLSDAVQALLAAGIEIHCLRDLTRGGLASALNEIAVSAGVEIEIDESFISVREDVRAVCEILGFDPLYVANEGRFIAFVPEADVESALEVFNLYQSGISEGGLSGAIARAIGSVTQRSTGLVKLKSKIGVRRIVHLLSGEQLPRIC